MILTDLLTWGEPMKQKQLAKLAAFLVGAMGGAAFGDDHVSGLVVDCSNVGWDCFDECLVKSSSRNACSIGILFPHKASCWSGNRPNPCDLASVHTHPYFLKKDAGTRCHGRPINEERAKAYNNGGMEFSGVGGDNDATALTGLTVTSGCPTVPA